MNVLLEAYPKHPWDQEKFSRQRQKKSNQWWLYKIIKEILPLHIEVIEEYSHPFLKLQTGSTVIFDVFIPSMNMAFEYYGFQHFYYHVMFGDVKSRKERDEERIRACQALGLTTVLVPYWWQRDKESIVAMLHKHRPDIVTELSAHNTIPFYYT